MNKFTKIATIINATHNLNEMERQVQSVKNSNLTEEEKTKALKAHNKMIKTTVLTVIILTTIIGVLIGVGFTISVEAGAVISIISMIIMIVILVTYIIVGKRKLFPDWENAYNKVDKGFDGLNEEEINKLKPNIKEEELIKKYKRKSAVCIAIFLVAIVLEFIILLNLGFLVYSPLTIIITFVITGIFYVAIDSYDVEIHRIQSGYYKKSFGYVCQKCKREVRINFEEIEKYNSLPRNKNGNRFVNCPNCGNDVPFYNFDNTLADYRKYLQQTK